MNRPHHHRQRGVSIVDVMFAIFIFSVGILGIAGLQTISKHSNYTAIQRTTAVMLANDILERMRANANQVAAYYGTFAPVPDNAEPTPVCDASNPCTPAQLAAHDLWEWQQAILGATDQVNVNNQSRDTGGLVQPSACITQGASSSELTIAIVWRGQTATSNPTSTSCGDDQDYGTGNKLRQVFVVNATINPMV